MSLLQCPLPINYSINNKYYNFLQSYYKVIRCKILLFILYPNGGRMRDFWSCFTWILIAELPVVCGVYIKRNVYLIIFEMDETSSFLFLWPLKDIFELKQGLPCWCICSSTVFSVVSIFKWIFISLFWLFGSGD